MADFTLSELFGANAAQDQTNLTISKADLASVGLTAQASNSAESLVVAIFLKWLATMTESNRLLDEVNRQIALSDAGTDIYDGATATFMRRNFAISLYKPYTIPSVDPDDY